MQKLILDTNVIVSALISDSIPTKILYHLVLTRKVEICLSEEIFAEYVQVLNRDKFSKFSNFKTKSEIVLNKVREIATFFRPEIKLNILADQDDNKFLELASISVADYLTTGNTLHFNLSTYEFTRILTPREYWESFAPK